MSYDNGLRIWVGDLDGYVDIDAINRANEREAEEDQLNYELDQIGEVRLMDGKAISAHKLNSRGIAPSEWRHALYQAETAIRIQTGDPLHEAGSVRHPVESQFLRAMHDLGRSYAIARYARWEKLDFSSARIAIMSQGIRAMINQWLVAEGINRTRDIDNRIRNVFYSDGEISIAYRRTGLLQNALHGVADDAPEHHGKALLDRDRMRNILSLARLYFSTVELKLSSIDELRNLLATYDAERKTAFAEETLPHPHRRAIRAWRLRHVRPLVDLFPYAVRHGLKRCIAHESQLNLQSDLTHAEASANSNRQIFVNELALAHCGVLLMRRAGRDRTRSK